MDGRGIDMYVLGEIFYTKAQVGGSDDQELLMP